MELIKENINKYKSILEKIEQYDTIVVYRHELPDFDASGTQIGLTTWLKESFPNKTIYRLGKDFEDFTPSLFTKNDEVKLEDLHDFLAIVVDTSNEKRIDDKSYQLAKEIIKFDHHPYSEEYGVINVINPTLASCSELLLNFILYCSDKYPLSKDACKYFFIGIVGDSQRFLISSTSSATLDAASFCINQGINFVEEVYQPMYEKDLNDFEVQKYILNNYKVSPYGVAYYILKCNELEKLNIRVEQTKKYLSNFANVKGINIWCAISEDKDTHEYWVSIRSKKVKISDVAKKYRGGGHDLASGANLKSLDELDEFINDLDNLIKDGID